jgi:uncharacterized protein with beta-barrel porin domain
LSESLPSIVEGPIGTDAVVVSGKAGGALDLWTPVIVTVGPTATDPVTVTGTTTADDPKVYGVVVGPKLASGKAADAAGDKVNIVKAGQAKLKVNGNTVNIAIGDALVTDTNGLGVKLDITGTVNAALLQKMLAAFAKALLASTADGDVIPVEVYQSRGTAKTS